MSFLVIFKEIVFITMENELINNTNKNDETFLNTIQYYKIGN